MGNREKETKPHYGIANIKGRVASIKKLAVIESLTEVLHFLCP